VTKTLTSDMEGLLALCWTGAVDAVRARSPSVIRLLRGYRLQQCRRGVKRQRSAVLQPENVVPIPGPWDRESPSITARPKLLKRCRGCPTACRGAIRRPVDDVRTRSQEPCKDDNGSTRKFGDAQLSRRVENAVASKNPALTTCGTSA
jgi:hypothetical protein